VLAQGLPWQIMIGAGRSSSSTFAVLEAGNAAPSLFGALAPQADMLFWEGSSGQFSQVFPRPEPIVAAKERLCHGRQSKVKCLSRLPLNSSRLLLHRDGHPPAPQRDQSPRPPTSRCVSCRGPTDVPASRHTASKATKLSQRLACCLAVQK
jgi:hypothetical protein